MASREERMQQRLRGAQRRQVKDVDFGFVVPATAAPSEPVAPTQQSPPPELEQSEVPQPPSTRRTPTNRPPSSAKTVPSGKFASVIAHSANDANTSAKRRKLDTDATPSTSSRSTRSSQKASRVDVLAYPEDDAQKDDSVLETSVGSHRQAINSEATSEAEIIPTTALRISTPNTSRAGEEVTESPYDAPGSGQRIRPDASNSILASSQLQSIQNDSSLISETQTPVPRGKRKRTAEAQSLLPGISDEQPSRASMTTLAEDDLDELSPEQPAIRSRARIDAHSPDLSEPAIITEPEEQDEAEAIDDEQAAKALKKNRGRRSSRNLRAESPNLDINAEILKPPAGRKQKRGLRTESSPVTQRQPKKPTTASSKPQVSKKSDKRIRVRVGSPIPITIHRLTRPLLFDEEEDGAAILNMDIPYAKRKGVNAVDVLSQVCQEMVGSALDTLEEGGNNCDDASLRREYKTKWNAVSSFGRELQSRLLEHTINLDNSYSLGRRLKDEHKRKLVLREEILRVRAEREQVALRMDEVRIRHEKEKKAALRRDTLNTAINDVELAVDVGKSLSDATESGHLVGTELLLKRVAGEVSSIGPSGGLLKQIQDFNAFLERAAQVLEARKG